MRYNSDVSIERVNELLIYSIISGHFWWKDSCPAKRRVAGKRAGSLNQLGRRQIQIDGKVYSANRLAWFMVTGRWPDPEVDHEDLEPDHNAWINLREASRSQNRANTRLEARNKSGLKGVHWRAVMRRWCASIKKDGVAEKIGYFDTAEEAHAVYAKRAAELYGEFARVA